MVERLVCVLTMQRDTFTVRRIESVVAVFDSPEAAMALGNRLAGKELAWTLRTDTRIREWEGFHSTKGLFVVTERPVRKGEE